jgi:hypothetical protein
MSDSGSRAQAERARLHGYIANSRRVRRQLRIALPIGVALAIGAWMFHSSVGLTLLALTLGVVGIGYWITHGHIAEWNTRLEAMDRGEVVADRRAR